MNGKKLKTRILIRNGSVQGIYNDQIGPQLHRNLGGKAEIRRASHVEAPLEKLDSIQFEVDLSPSNGPKIEGFTSYETAVQAEVDWLHENTLKA